MTVGACGASGWDVRLRDLTVLINAYCNGRLARYPVVRYRNRSGRPEARSVLAVACA